MPKRGVTVARALHDGFHELHCLAFLSLACWSQGDYPQVLAWVMIVVTSVIIFNLIVDIAYAVLDPRIRYA